MNNVLPTIRDTVSISQFNKGLAGKIFKEVHESGAKVVIKNNAPEAVILSKKEYAEIIDDIMKIVVIGARADEEVYRAASKRTKKYDL